MTDLDGALVALRATGRRPPLYCVHAVSGSPWVYAGLAQVLGEERPVYGFEAPGFDNDRPPAETLPALSADYVEVLRAHRPDGPYLLLGWSMGGAIAFEMARRIEREGGAVPLLVLVDSAVPERYDPPDERWMVRRFLHDLVAISDGLSGRGVEEALAAVPAATPEEAFARIEELGVFPEEIDADFLTDRFTVFRGHLRILHAHAATAGYPGPVVSVRASESPADHSRWERVAENVTEYVFEGGHHGMWSGDGLTWLARIVARHLEPADLAARR